MEGKAQSLQFFVESEAQVVGEQVADRLAIIIVDQGKRAAQHRSAQQQ